MKLYFQIFIFLFPAILFAEAPPVVMEKGKELYELGFNLDIYEDKTGKLTINDVIKPEWLSKFKTSKKKVPNFGFTSSHFWARVKITNPSKVKGDWFLSFNYVLQDHVSFYKKENGEWISEDMGDEKKFSERKIKVRPFALEINTEGEQVYFVKISGGLCQINLTLVSQKQMLSKEGEDNQVYGIFFGIIISMVLYNIFILFSTKSYSYFFYVIYVFFYGLFLAGYQGFTQKYLFYNHPWFSNNGLSFVMGISELFLTLFTISYLNIGAKNKKLFLLFKISIAGGIVVILSSLINPYAVNVKLFFLNAAFISFLAYGTAIYKWIKGYRPARYFTLAFSFMIIGSMLTNLAMANIIPNLAAFRQAVIIGTALQLIFLSMGLADRFNLIQEEAKKLQENYAEELENEVQRQTEEVRKQTKEAVSAKLRAEGSEREVANLINNMRQSVFCIDETHIISPPVSNFSNQIFGESIEKMPIYDTLYRSMDRKGENFSKIYTALGVIFNADELQWDLVKDLLPQRIILKNDEEKILKVRYTPLWTEGGILEKLMFVIEDITELEALEKQMKSQKEEISKKGNILQELAANKREELQNFFDGANKLSNESISIWKEIRAAHHEKVYLRDKMEVFLRNLHTIKGNARIYGFSVISQKTHESETKVVSFKEDIFSERETSDFDNYLSELYNLRGQINEYFLLAKDIFGIESEDDSKFKNEIHELMKDFEYWIGKPYFNSKATESILPGPLSFLISIVDLDKDIKTQTFSSLKRILHSLKGVSRSMNEGALSESIHTFEGTIHELNLGQAFSGEQLNDAFQAPLDVIRESARKMYISSSLFKPFIHESEVYLDFYVNFFKLLDLFKNSKEDNKQETTKALYSLMAISMEQGFLYTPCVLRSIYDLFKNENVLKKEKIKPALQKIWSHFKFIIQIDIEKVVPSTLRDSLKSQLSQYDTIEEWTEGLKEISKNTGLSQDPLLIKILKRFIEENISINNFISNINFLESRDKGRTNRTLSSLVPSTDVSGLLNDVFSGLKNNFNRESVENILSINKIESETLEGLVSVINDSRTGWFPYLESIDLMRILRDFIKADDEDKNIRPEMFEVLTENFYSIKEKIIEELNSPEGFSIGLIEKQFDVLKQIPIKYSLKNLRMMVLEMSKALGKKIKFSLKGEQGSLSKNELALLKDGIVHLVRNSVDHGIEEPEKRKKSNKEDFGLIGINCFMSNDNKLNLEIKDDGKGINPDFIIEKALSKKFVTKEQVDKMSDLEKLNIIFLPNFSTKENVTEISGRGVGMDVVKKNLEKIGASIDLKTAVGEGTTFTIKLK